MSCSVGHVFDNEQCLSCAMRSLRSELESTRRERDEAIADADVLRNMRLDESSGALKARLSEARREIEDAKQLTNTHYDGKVRYRDQWAQEKAMREKAEAELEAAKVDVALWIRRAKYEVARFAALKSQADALRDVLQFAGTVKTLCGLALTTFPGHETQEAFNAAYALDEKATKALASYAASGKETGGKE